MSEGPGPELVDILPLPEDEEPIAPRGLRGLFAENLFKDAKNSLMTLAFGAALLYLLYRVIRYVFITGRWEVISEGPLVAYMVGLNFNRTGLSYANVWAAIFLLAIGFGFAMGLAVMRGGVPGTRRQRMVVALPPALAVGVVLALTRTITPTLLVLVTIALGIGARRVTPRLPERLVRRAGVVWFVLPVLVAIVLTGGNPTHVNNFGGLLLNVVVAAGGILLSFPVGVMLALARRSSFPLIRPLAVTYIELIRGVPLITLLFMGQYAIGFFLPPGVEPPGQIPRAIIMITMFAAAYVAEVVRGGLQSVPTGQTEAGQALGLSPIRITGRIVLPQALRNSIPALIGTFISLLKDTTLLTIIAVHDVLGVTGPILAQLRFNAQGYQPETFAFVGFLFWVICFSMSRASQRLEARLGVGTR